LTQCIALLRGINVGRSKRISMGDLRKLFSDLGHLNVRTLLNSGNVIFQTQNPKVGTLSAAIEAAILAGHGFSAAVTVITAKELSNIIDENPLLKVAKDPSRHLVAFPADLQSLLPLRSLLEQSWAPDKFAVGTRAAYLWCESGILESKLNQTFARKAGTTVTARNWATVLKLQNAAHGE
jgi:uncharacterized protein (DUF1697 family)